MRGKASGYLYNGFRCDVEDAILLATIKTNYGSVNRRGQGGDRKAPLSRPQARFPLQREKSRNMEVQCEGASGATAKPPTRLRRGETSCNKKDQHRENKSFPILVWSRPSGATICEWSNVQLEGAPAGAQSYWQGRFAACTFVGRVLHTGRPRNGWGVAPNPTRGAAP